MKLEIDPKTFNFKISILGIKNMCAAINNSIKSFAYSLTKNKLKRIHKKKNKQKNSRAVAKRIRDLKS